MDHTVSLSHLVGGMCPSCSIVSRTGAAMLRTSVGGAGVTGEEHESESQISLALQRDPVLCVALRSGSGTIPCSLPVTRPGTAFYA